jgi:hypothetical protein
LRLAQNWKKLVSMLHHIVDLPPSSPFKCAVERRGTPVGESVKPTRQLSLQPVATEASVEVMKHSKPSV